MPDNAIEESIQLPPRSKGSLAVRFNEITSLSAFSRNIPGIIPEISSIANGCYCSVVFQCWQQVGDFFIHPDAHLHLQTKQGSL